MRPLLTTCTFCYITVYMYNVYIYILCIFFSKLLPLRDKIWALRMFLRYTPPLKQSCEDRAVKFHYQRTRSQQLHYKGEKCYKCFPSYLSSNYFISQLKKIFILFKSYIVSVSVFNDDIVFPRAGLGCVDFPCCVLPGCKRDPRYLSRKYPGTSSG